MLAVVVVVIMYVALKLTMRDLDTVYEDPHATYRFEEEEEEGEGGGGGDEF